ncbi:MAG: C10 family peptidase [Phocaeicola sp.]|nr:C10 family peptidase [Phocaeicola sp.]
MKRLIFFSLAVLLMTGCKQQDDESMFPDRPDVREYVVSTDEAENAAFYFLYMTDNQVQTRNAVRDVKDAPVIKKKFTIEGYNGKPAMHVINYEKGGFTVISGDKRIEPVIAYSDTGDWSDNPLDYPDGLRIWIDCVKNEIKAMNEQGTEPSDELKNLWETYVPSVTTRIINPPTHPCENPDEYDITKGPFLCTHWHQDLYFNELMPVITCSGLQKHAYAGCVPIAIAKLAKYYQHPTNYVWNSMPNTYASTATKQFILDIHNYFNSLNVITYDCDGTSVTTTYIPNLFSFWGYNASYTSYNTYNLRNTMIIYEKPTILIGYSTSTGHAWICDGAHEWIECIYDEANQSWSFYTALKFHMNWGWGGNYDGMFWAGTTYSVNNTSFSNLTILNVGLPTQN